MWALVKANQVIEIIMFPKSIESSGIVYNKNIFSKSATEQKKIGLYSVIIDKPADERFEMNCVTTYALDSKKEKVIQKIKKKEKKLNDVTQVDADGKDILDENGNKVITKGLKSFYIESIKQQANTLLKPSDWLVHRFVEDNTKKIPDDVKTYRKKVRDTSDTIITKIQATKTLSDLKKLFSDATIKDGKVTTPNTMDSMPQSTIQEYER